MTADLRERLQSSLGSIYTLDRELSGGGMARVFTAKDNTLGRTVVVKVLPPEMAAGVSTERFKREIAVAARLQHPHIVPLLSAGEIAGEKNGDGTPYFTMPFIAGESLRVRLARHGEMPVSEAVRIMREIASALAHAHEHGVVHRDIKPDNVLFADDVAMVADFGVAKALAGARVGSGEAGTGNSDSPSTSVPGSPFPVPTVPDPITTLGVALGTPAYMAPEQATADPTTDHRADIYAFGIVAYEMLTGQPPFTGRNLAQLLAAHVTEPVEPISRRRPNIPPGLAALVMRCVEKRPADRPQRASEIVHALDDITTPSGGMAPTGASLPAVGGAATALATAGGSGRWNKQVALVAGVAVLAATTLGVTMWKRGSADPSMAAAAAVDGSATRIAVLPFENLGDSSDAYFADGMTDAVRGKLTGLPGMQVIARASARQYQGTTKSPEEIARELGVRYLLTGTVRWAKGAGGSSHVQVSPELVEISSDGTASSKWQQPFDAEMADVFRVQGEIAGKVAEAMSVAVGGVDRARLVEVPTRNAAAYDAFLRGEALYWRGGGGSANIRRAISEYEQATRLDTNFAAAWASLGRARGLLYANGVPTPELGRAARDAVDRALRLAPNAAFAHGSSAVYFLNVEPKPRLALVEMEKARALTPNDPEVITRLASVQLALGRFEDALQSARNAQQLDPKSVVPLVRLQAALTYLRRGAEARIVSDQLLALQPTPGNYQTRILVSLGDGDIVDARRILQDGLRRVNPDELIAYMATYWDLGWVLRDEEQQRALTLGPEAFDDDRATRAIVRAQIYGWRGDSALARAWGDSAAREFEIQSRRAIPNDPQQHLFLGLALAYAGRRSEALARGRRGLELITDQDYVSAAYFRHLLARIYLLVGEQDEALDIIEPLVTNPYHVSRAWLRIDPTFAPLEGNLRFEKLIAQ